MLPSYNNLNLKDYKPYRGYYTFELIRQHGPNICFIDHREVSDPRDVSWIRPKIDSALAQGQKVIFAAWDEYLLGTPKKEFIDIFNNYENQPVWMATLLDEQAQKIFRFQHGYQCNILELPWIVLNDLLCYATVANRDASSEPSNYNYLTMLGRYEPHKLAVGQALYAEELHHYGLITVGSDYPETALEFAQINPQPSYGNNNGMPMMSNGQTIGEIAVSDNLLNYLYIDQTYKNIPLIIHPETTTGIIGHTEKSYWPLLLGKMMLLHAWPHCLSSIQRFYTLPFDRYSDTLYDTVEGYTSEAIQERLHVMISANRLLIKNSHDIYQELKPEIEQARWSLIENMYNFFKQQLEKV